MMLLYSYYAVVLVLVLVDVELDVLVVNPFTPYHAVPLYPYKTSFSWSKNISPASTFSISSPLTGSFVPVLMVPLKSVMCESVSTKLSGICLL